MPIRQINNGGKETARSRSFPIPSAQCLLAICVAGGLVAVRCLGRDHSEGTPKALRGQSYPTWVVEDCLQGRMPSWLVFVK